MTVDLKPFACTIGGSFFVGLLTWCAIKKIIKIAAVTNIFLKISTVPERSSDLKTMRCLKKLLAMSILRDSLDHDEKDLIASCNRGARLQTHQLGTLWLRKVSPDSGFLDS